MLFEVKRSLYDDLAGSHAKHLQYEMSIFLSYIDLFQKMPTDQINEIANHAKVEKFTKGQTVIDKDVFDFKKFFIVRRGQVDLIERVQVESVNFFPEQAGYKQRVKAKSISHRLGTVR